MKKYIHTLLITAGLGAALLLTSEYSNNDEAYHIDKVDTIKEIEHQEPATVKESTFEETNEGFFVRLGRDSQNSESDVLLPMDAGLLDQTETEASIQAIEEQIEEARTTGLI